MFFSITSQFLSKFNFFFFFFFFVCGFLTNIRVLCFIILEYQVPSDQEPNRSNLIILVQIPQAMKMVFFLVSSPASKGRGCSILMSLVQKFPDRNEIFFFFFQTIQKASECNYQSCYSNGDF